MYKDIIKGLKMTESTANYQKIMRLDPRFNSHLYHRARQYFQKQCSVKMIPGGFQVTALVDENSTTSEKTLAELVESEDHRKLTFKVHKHPGVKVNLRPLVQLVSRYEID